VRGDAPDWSARFGRYEEDAKTFTVVYISLPVSLIVSIALRLGTRGVFFGGSWAVAPIVRAEDTRGYIFWKVSVFKPLPRWIGVLWSQGNANNTQRKDHLE
jgi:hypothetical protein